MDKEAVQYSTEYESIRTQRTFRTKQ